MLADLGLLGVDGGFEGVGAAALEGLDARLQCLRFRLCGIRGRSQSFGSCRGFLLLLVGPCDELRGFLGLGLELGDELRFLLLELACVSLRDVDGVTRSHRDAIDAWGLVSYAPPTRSFGRRRWTFELLDQ